MPELPEVETVRRDLCRLAGGQRVKSVRFLREDMLTGATARHARRVLKGATISDVDRHGKALILRFSSGYALIVHFRMTGYICVAGPGDDLPSHVRTLIELEDGRRLAHVDLRRLGTLELVRLEKEHEARTLANIGPDAVKQPLDVERMMEVLARRTIAIKVFLLDQRVMSGIGNIYASEILARARIAPNTPCNRLTKPQARGLLRETKKVLAEAIEFRGTTISDFRTGTGSSGGFQAKLRVYGRDGEKCLRRGCRSQIERMVQSQRSTFYCPTCQELHGRRPGK